MTVEEIISQLRDKRYNPPDMAHRGVIADALERLAGSREPKPQTVPHAEDYSREYKLRVLSAARTFNETPFCECAACWEGRDRAFMGIMRAVFNDPAEPPQPIEQFGRAAHPFVLGGNAILASLAKTPLPLPPRQ